MKVSVVINEQHSIMKDQVRAIKDFFGDVVDIIFERIPAEGLTKEELIEKSIEMMKSEEVKAYIFASPIPVMLMTCTRFEVGTSPDVYTFHNDNREKKELPNGKIIMTVAQTGWKVV